MIDFNQKKNEDMEKLVRNNQAISQLVPQVSLRKRPISRASLKSNSVMRNNGPSRFLRVGSKVNTQN